MKQEKKLIAKNPIVATNLKPQTHLRISIYGASGTGKSRLSLAIARKLWEENKERNILIIDTEQRAQYSVVKELSEAYSLGKVLISNITKEHNIVDFWAGLEKIIKDYDPCVVVIDSISYIGGLHSEDPINQDKKDPNDYMEYVTQNKFRDYNGVRVCEKVTFDLLKNLNAHLILCGLATSQFKQMNDKTVINLLDTNNISDIHIKDCKAAISEMAFVYYLLSYNHCIVRKDGMYDLTDGKFPTIKNFSIDSIKYLYDGTLTSYLSLNSSISELAEDLAIEMKKHNNAQDLTEFATAHIKSNTELTSNDKVFLKEEFIKCKKNIEELN